MPDPEQLRKQLDEIEIHWNSLRVEFAGPAPGPRCSEADWSSATVCGFVTRRDPKLSMDFSQAWHSVVKQLRGLIWSQLQPWVAAVILEHGLPVDIRSIPDPPHERIPDGLGTLESATGSADLAEAGFRVLFWCAADLKPEVFQRTAAHSVCFHAWTGRILEFSDTAICPMKSVMQAIKTAFPILVQSDRLRRPIRPIFTNEADGDAPHRIIHICDDLFLVMFEGERALIRDKTAERLVRILRDGRAWVSELCGRKAHVTKTKQVGTNRGKKSTQPQREKRRSEFGDNPEDARKKARMLRKLIEKDKNALLHVTDHSARAKLEHDIESYEMELNRMRRVEKSQEDKDLESLKKGFQRLFSSIEKDNPRCRLLEHLRDAIQLSPDEKFYRYNGGLTWAFEELATGHMLS